jgi:hypothetical protein
MRVEATENNQSEIKTMHSMNTLLREIGIAVSFFEESLTIRTDFKVDKLDISFPNIAKHSREVNPFTGSLLNSMKYEIIPYGDGCELRLKFSYYISKSEYYELVNFADNFVLQMEGMSDYEKVKFTHDYLIKNCEYNIDMDGPYNCIFNKQCNCNGYALAFCLIMQTCDIECYYITGTDHAWNSIKLGSFWYNIDVTWDDIGGDNISYDYFLCGRHEWKKHRTTEATAGYKYNENELINWMGTMFYWGWPILIVAIIVLIRRIIRRIS